MSIKFRITKCLAVSALAMLLLGACSKNNIYIDLADPNEENGNGHPSGNDSGNDNGNPSKEGTLVTFSASVEGRNITRAMSPMGKGLQSWLCAYLSNTSNIITGDPIAEGTYITSSPGVLAGNNGYKMYLSNNIYNFYAVSCNSKNPDLYQRDIRPFIQWSRLSLVARYAPRRDKLPDQHSDHLPARSYANSSRLVGRCQYNSQQDYLRLYHSAETGRSHGFVYRNHHFGNNL